MFASVSHQQSILTSQLFNMPVVSCAPSEADANSLLSSANGTAPGTLGWADIAALIAAQQQQAQTPVQHVPSQLWTLSQEPKAELPPPPPQQPDEQQDSNVNAFYNCLLASTVSSLASRLAGNPVESNPIQLIPHQSILLPNGEKMPLVIQSGGNLVPMLPSTTAPAPPPAKATNLLHLLQGQLKRENNLLATTPRQTTGDQLSTPLPLSMSASEQGFGKQG